jgi:glycosyltransferase involved in cell wall biosynthesis
MGMKENTVTHCKKSILWVNFFHLDLEFNKSALDIFQQFSRIGYQSSLIVARSTSKPQIGNLLGRIFLIPLKRIPLILRAMYAILIFFFLPVYLLIFKPTFVVMQPDVYVLSSVPSVLISKLLKVKFILDVRSIPVETAGLRGYLQKFWFFVSIIIAKKLFDGMTIITPLMKKEVCEDFNIDPSKVGVWTSGVSDSLFNPESLSLAGSKLKKQLGLSDKFVVFYHGVFSATRGLVETIEAIKLLKPKYPNIVFFLLGNGDNIDRLKALIQKEDLQENVLIHSPVEQSEVPKYIDFCDVAIVPLPYHRYWRLEYLSMKKVTIISDIPAHRLIVDEEKCGIYISSVKPLEIAKSIEYAYNNRDKLLSWGTVGREIIQREYTWEKVAKDLDDYLVSIQHAL